MADFAPVATQIQPPNPMQGLQAYSTLLGIRQQNLDYQRSQQQLQTGAIQQQGLQAQTSQLQQQNQEMQQAGQLLQKVHGGGYRNKDGTLDRSTLADDLASIGPYAGESSSRMLSQANEIVQNQTAKQSLTDASRTALGDTLTSLASNPGTTRGDVVEAVTNFMVTHRNDPSAFRVAAAQLALLPQNDQDPRFRQVLSNFAGSLTGKSQSTPTTIDTGGAVIPGASLNATGGFTPASADKQGNPVGITKTLAPTQKPDYMGTIASIPEDQQRYTDISKGTASARAMVSLADQVAALSDQVRTGKYSKTVTDYMATIGQHDPGIAARQLLAKYAAQLKVMGSTGAPTDNARQGVEESLPNPESMSPEAVKEGARYVAGIGDLNLARSQRASAYVQRKGSANGLRTSDDSFTGKYAPEDFAYRRMPAGTERQRFLLNRFGDGSKITDVAGAKAFVSRQKEIGGGGRQ